MAWIRKPHSVMSCHGSHSLAVAATSMPANGLLSGGEEVLLCLNMWEEGSPELILQLTWPQ